MCDYATQKALVTVRKVLVILTKRGFEPSLDSYLSHSGEQETNSSFLKIAFFGILPF